MVGLNTYISGLDLSALKEYCVNHGRITQYAKGDYFVKEGEEFYFQLCLGLQINFYVAFQIIGNYLLFINCLISNSYIISREYDDF